MGERWDEGEGGNGPALKKQKKQKKHCLFLVFLEIQKQKHQKKHCLLYVLCDTNIEIPKKALSF
jgi:hypothetical protein